MRIPHRHGDRQNGGDYVKKGPWSAEEDEKLMAYIQKYGIWIWNHMPKAAGLARTGKSCRLRWLNYLRPNIRHGIFTREEEETIIKWQQQMGNRWSEIAKKLPGRTDNDIKNYWNTRLKKRHANDGHIKRIRNDISGIITATISIDCDGTQRASSKETRETLTSRTNSHSTSSFASSDITSQHGEEHTSSLDVDEELKRFWEKLIPLEDLTLPSYKLQGFTYSSDLFGDFNFDLRENSYLIN